MAEGNSGGRSE